MVKISTQQEIKVVQKEIPRTRKIKQTIYCMSRYDKDISEGRIHGKLGLDRAGDIIIKLQADGDDLVFKQFDGYEVARIHDGASVDDDGGGLGYKKLIIEKEEAFDMSAVATYHKYSGMVMTVGQLDDTAYAITLPTATSPDEGKLMRGWHISLIVTQADAYDITIIRGDTSNDHIYGTVVAGDAAASGITIGRHVITFVGELAAVGDRVDITCVIADEDNTVYTAQGFCAV